MLKTTLAAALLAATLGTTAGVAPAAASEFGWQVQIGGGPSWGWEDRRWRGDHKRDWRHDRRYDRRHDRACKVTWRVTHVYDDRGRLIRVVEKPVEVCNRRHR